MKLESPHTVKSHVFYQFFVWIFHLWNLILSIITLVLVVRKVMLFWMKTGARDFNICSPFLLFIVNILKLELGGYGNRSEHIVLLVFACIFGLGSIAMDMYFILLQPYLWDWEIAVHSVATAWDCIFVIATIALIVIFAVK